MRLSRGRIFRFNSLIHGDLIHLTQAPDDVAPETLNMPASQRFPAIFFGHGSPMNALADNVYTRAWSALGRSLPTPRAILAISAHWQVPGTRLTAMERPPTIHDFGGFPPELFAMQYPAAGDAELVQRTIALLAPIPVLPDQEWGLDHGTWSVLCHVFPQADIPVVQMSLDARLSAAEHYALAKRLTPLRDEGVLIMATGNVVHNLRQFYRGDPNAAAQPWAERFDKAIHDYIVSGDHRAVLAYASLGEDAQLAVPSEEHFLPLVYVLAQQQPDEAVSFPTRGIEGGSISMLSVKIG
jgi:4,5-DOPA dioxygenase extradiol